MMRLFDGSDCKLFALMCAQKIFESVNLLFVSTPANSASAADPLYCVAGFG